MAKRGREKRAKVVRWYWSEYLAEFYKKDGEEIFQFYRKLVDEDIELRKKLLEETFVDLVKKRYVEDYLNTKPEAYSAETFQDFLKQEYVQPDEEKETAVVVSKARKKQGFKIIEDLSEYYTIVFEYRDGQLIYDDIHADEVFDAIWGDINLILEFVGKYLGGMSKERAERFRQYLLEDAEVYPNSNEIKQQIKQIFLQLEVNELVQDIRGDILEAMGVAPGSMISLESCAALEVFTSGRLHIAAAGIVPYEDTRQTLRQPFAEQYGLKLWTTLYEQAPLSPKSQERIRRFLMSNFYELFLLLVPYEIVNSKQLEQDIAARNKLAMEFKYVMDDFLVFLNELNNSSGLLITKGGYGKAAYLVTKENLAMLYADELALKEVYEKYAFTYPAVQALFKKMYRWTKDVDEKLELNNTLQKKRDRALKQYLYSYEEEEAHIDTLPRRLLGKASKIPVSDEMSEIVEMIKKD